MTLTEQVKALPVLMREVFGEHAPDVQLKDLTVTDLIDREAVLTILAAALSPTPVAGVTLDVEQLRGLSDAATPGPWKRLDTGSEGCSIVSTAARQRHRVARLTSAPLEGCQADAALLVAAVNYVRAALSPTPEAAPDGLREALMPHPWPRPEDFDKMSAEEFHAYVERVGLDASIKAALAEPVEAAAHAASSPALDQALNDLFALDEARFDAVALAAREMVRDATALAAPRSLEAPEAAPDGLRVLVNEQAEDEGLWFIAETAPEAYLQQELRRLHATVEAAPRSLDAAWAAELDRLREVAQAVLVELDIIRKRRDESSNSPPPYGLIVHIDTHNDLRAALDALTAKLREPRT